MSNSVKKDVESIKKKFVSRFREYCKRNSSFEIDILGEFISDDVSSLFPPSNLFLSSGELYCIYSPLQVYSNDSDHRFLDVAYREEMSSLIEELTHGFLALNYRPFVFSRKPGAFRSVKMSEYSKLGDFNLDPGDIKNSYLFLWFPFNFSTCSDEICLLKKRLATAIDGSSPGCEVEGLRSDIRYLEGFAVEDSAERGLSYCLRWNDDFGISGKYQAWSPGSIPAHIMNGHGEITLCTAVYFMPNPKYFGEDILEMESFVRDFMKKHNLNN